MKGLASLAGRDAAWDAELGRACWCSRAWPYKRNRISDLFANTLELSCLGLQQSSERKSTENPPRQPSNTQSPKVRFSDRRFGSTLRGSWVKTPWTHAWGFPPPSHAGRILLPAWQTAACCSPFPCNAAALECKRCCPKGRTRMLIAQLDSSGDLHWQREIG